ncbi:hypothetical protein J2753_001985 [Halolamina salifodinae]|uniref:Uncharacterized protein n=1 Tax=Halolamina salifodinae TaxID=1202767 RepID=A0A8T4H119_9EURY|nr:hypothetical protein [Halolamina salifodinae]
MLDVCSTVEGRERSGEDVALFAEWIALVLVVPEWE